MNALESGESSLQDVPYAFEPGWLERLSRESPARAAAILAAADELRDGDSAAQRLALGCYEGLWRRIDPASRDGAERVRWIVREASELSPGLEPLLRRAADVGRDEDLRHEASVALAGCLAARGELGRAEAHLRRELTAVRGTGRRAEFAACSRLHALFARQHRVFESLVLARRARSLAEQGGTALERADAWSRLAFGLLAVQAFEELEEPLDAMETLVREVPPHQRQRVVVALAELRAQRAIELSLTDEALRHLDLAQSSFEATGVDGEPLRTLHVLRARALLHSGQPLAAERSLRCALEGAASDDPLSFRARYLEARCALADGRTEVARRLADEALAQLTDGLASDFGTGAMIRLGSHLGNLLRDCGDLVRARDAYDLAGHAAVQRIVELDECMRSLPELSADEATDRRLLARARLSHLATHRELLAAVAQVFEHAIAADEPWARPLMSDDGRFHVCPRCHRFRPERGEWVPGGHYLTGQRVGRVTHGMCEDCFGAVRDRLAGPERV